MTVLHGVVIGLLIALPVALVRGIRARIVTAAVLPVVAGAALLMSGTFESDVVSTLELSSPVMDIEMVDDAVGYASLADGSIVRLAIEGQRVSAQVVTTGLQNPRGVAVTGDDLHVAELGGLPCETQWCMEPEARILEQSSGRVTRFRIGGGGLTDPSVLVDGLPVANSEHGVNDVESGPDGALYVSVGHVGSLVADRAALAAVEHPRLDLLGTILRIDPTDGDVQVVARGLRNAYGLAFDEEGRLFTVDNGGLALGGWRSDEIIAVREGADYGYPEDGTFPPFLQRTESPLGIVDDVGAAGILITTDAVLVGTERHIERHPLVRGPTGRVTTSDPTYVELPRCFYATSIARVNVDTVLVGCASQLVLLVRADYLR
jgi:hypothetical protein